MFESSNQKRQLGFVRHAGLSISCTHKLHTCFASPTHTTHTTSLIKSHHVRTCGAYKLEFERTHAYCHSETCNWKHTVYMQLETYGTCIQQQAPRLSAALLPCSMHCTQQHFGPLPFFVFIFIKAVAAQKEERAAQCATSACMASACLSVHTTHASKTRLLQVFLAQIRLLYAAA